MTNEEFFQLQGQSLLFAVLAGLTLFFVSLFLLRHTLHSWLRAFVLLLSCVLLPFAAYFLTRNSHVALTTGLAGNVGMAIAIFVEAERRSATNKDTKDDSRRKEE